MKLQASIAVLVQLVALFLCMDFIWTDIGISFSGNKQPSSRDANKPEQSRDYSDDEFIWEGEPMKDYLDPEFDFQKCEAKCMNEFKCAAYTFYFAYDGNMVQLHCLLFEGIFFTSENCPPNEKYCLKPINRKNLPEGEKTRFRSGKIKDPWLLDEKISDKEYKYLADHLSWDKARAVCQANSGDLVSIRNKEELKFLKDIRSHFSYENEDDPSDRVWVGLRKTNGWKAWLDGTPFRSQITPWNYREPNNWHICTNQGEQCAQFKYDKGLNDEPCHGPQPCRYPVFHPFICERKEPK